jgi:hypothetical protein
MRRVLVASLEVVLPFAVRAYPKTSLPVRSRPSHRASSLVTMAESKSKHAEHWIRPGDPSGQELPKVKVYNSLTRSKVSFYAVFVSYVGF